MRHVFRTHRVALDWLLEPKIQIKYVDTEKLLTDILTIGSFTREEWNHFLRFFNIYVSQLPSDHVDEADAGRKTRRRRTRGSKMKPSAESGVEDSQSVSNSAEFGYISKPRNFTARSSLLDSVGMVTRSERLECEQRMNFSSEATRCKSELHDMNTVGARFFPHNFDISPINVEYLEKA